MHHAVLERWSRGTSFLHARDARVKILLLISFLIAVALARPPVSIAMAGYALLVLAGTLLARLPLGGLLVRAAAILPFSGAFAVMSALAGDSDRTVALVAKTYLSAAAVLLVAGTTPLPSLLRGLDSLGVPRFLTLVVQFVYRYLFVLSEQAQHMRLAALSRGWQLQSGRRDRSAFRASAGAVAVLFARSHQRAEGIHRAMLARSFRGRIVVAAPARFLAADWLFLACGTAMVLSLAALR